MKKLNIYFTAGVPKLEDTGKIAKLIQDSGADMMEIGIPYSDPVADGPVIQDAHSLALKNGMSIKKLFEQLAEVKDSVTIPKILMGYLNPVLQFGFENFCQKCAEIGIDGLIIPDLPVDVYAEQYKTTFEKYGLKNIFLITPQTSEERIRFIDSVSDGFIYMVSSASVTGSQTGFGSIQEGYFKRIADMNLKNPQIIGFGISNKETFNQATQFAKGAIIGSAFIQHLTKNGTGKIEGFVKEIRQTPSSR